MNVFNDVSVIMTLDRPGLQYSDLTIIENTTGRMLEGELKLRRAYRDTADSETIQTILVEYLF